MSAIRNKLVRIYKVLVALLSRFYGVEIIYKEDIDEKVLYITFDDGPDPNFTPPILEVLKKYNANATFFMVGNQVLKYPEIVGEIVGEGHLVGNHTSSHHKGWLNKPYNTAKAELSECESALDQFAPTRNKVFRAPWGVLNFRAIRAAKSQQLKIVHWSYDSKDYQKQGVQEIINRFDVEPVHPGDIILFHDDNLDTRNALEVLLNKWANEGYTFDICR